MMFAIIFLGGWRGPWAVEIPILGFVYFLIKTSVVYFLIILMRAALPRFRIDQMMALSWKFFTPLSLVVVMVTAVADKLMLGLPGWIRIGVLLALNALIWLAASKLLDKNISEQPRPEVGDRSRPVARPPVVPAASEPGGNL